MFAMGFAVFFSILLLFIKLPHRAMLRLLHYDLLIDFAVTVLVLFLHWGSFEGVMAATIAGLLTSLATSFTKRMFGHIAGNLYYPGWLRLNIWGAK
jgi:hypothetical protein